MPWTMCKTTAIIKTTTQDVTTRPYWAENLVISHKAAKSITKKASIQSIVDNTLFCILAAASIKGVAKTAIKVNLPALKQIAHHKDKLMFPNTTLLGNIKLAK